MLPGVTLTGLHGFDRRLRDLAPPGPPGLSCGVYAGTATEMVENPNACGGIAYSGGNLTVEPSFVGGGNYAAVTGTPGGACVPPSAIAYVGGPRIFEFTIVQKSATPETIAVGFKFPSTSGLSDGVLWYSDGSVIGFPSFENLGASAAFGTGDVLTFACCQGESRFWIAKNGVWQAPGAPAAGTGRVSASNWVGQTFAPKVGFLGGETVHRIVTVNLAGPFATGTPTGFIPVGA